MLRNYFRTAIRHFSRNKGYTAINILGLTLGTCCCIVIFLVYSFEFSFDKFHPDADRIYRVMGDVTENTGNKLHFARLPYALSRTKGLPEIETIAGIIPYNVSVNVPADMGNGKRFESSEGHGKFTRTAITQPAYFDIFRYKWLAGSASTLQEPFRVVLTESRALQYFGTSAVQGMLGRQVIYDDSLTVTVAGIVQDWSGNTDLGFTDFISSSTLQGNYLSSRIDTTQWAAHFMNTWTFAKLAQAADPKKASAQLQTVVKSDAGQDVKLDVWLEPLRDLHFNPNVIENPIRTADKATLYILLSIAAFILLLALINFVNLSTAASIQRAKEVGIRKVLGSSRAGLVTHFLFETLLVTFAAVAAACLFINPILYGFRSFLPTGVKFDLMNPAVGVFLLTLIIVTTILAGLYPARIMSAYSTISNLKGLTAQKGGEKWFVRKALVVFQLAVTVAFVIGSIVITRQLDYTRKKDRGFISDAILIVPTPWADSLSKVSVLSRQIKQFSTVSATAVQWLSPMTDNGRVMQLKSKSGDVKEFEVGQVAGDENFIPLYKIKLIAGRNLRKADSVNEFVINQTLLHYLGYKQPGDAIGNFLYWNNKPYPIVGVVSDFHNASFHDPIKPLCIINRPDRQHTIAVKLAPTEDISAEIMLTIGEIENAWKQFYPGETFNYQFYDEELAKLYARDEQTGTLINTAMSITIFISGIGLFGLILFVAARRTREISIRKILGASAARIVWLIGKDFALLATIALIIASPLAWYFMNSWLNNFAYRIQIDGLVFFAAAVISMLFVFVTVGFQTVKAAMANPVENLRSE